MMTRAGNHRVLIAFRAAALLAFPLCVRAGLLGLRPELGLRTGGAVRSWTVEEDGEEIHVDQVTFPLLLTAPFLEESLHLTLYTSGALSDYELSESASLSGLSDTSIRGSYRMENDRVLLIGGFSLPTGPTDLSDDEVRVSRAVSNQVLGFRTNRYGAGFDLFGNVLFAWPLGSRYSAGGAIGFARRGAFDYAPDAASGLGEVDPGDEFFLSAGGSYLGRQEGRALSLNLDLTYRLFGSDRVEGTEVFAEGNQIELLAAGALDTERWRLSARLHSAFKSDNSLEGSALEWSAGSALEDVVLANVTGDLFGAGATLIYRLTPVWDAGAAIRYSRYGEVSAEGVRKESSVAQRGSASVFEVGPTVTWAPREDLSFTLGGGVPFGSADGGDVTLSGYDLFLSSVIRL